MSELGEIRAKAGPGAEEWGKRMNWAYLVYCRIAAFIFIINTVYPVTTKLLQERLAHDWLHSVLHLCSALAAISAAWYASNIRLATIFTWGIGESACCISDWDRAVGSRHSPFRSALQITSFISP
jgi:hypothetical protein